jgi:deoxyribodipyrimidine photo-lyase
MSKSSVVIFWFRRDLRLEDNAGLWHSLQSGQPVLPLFIFDQDILDPLADGDPRVDFIHQTLVQLQDRLTALGSSLLVRHGRPLPVWQSLLAEFSVAAVYVNRDYEPQARRRDEVVAQLLRERGIPLHQYKDQVVFDQAEVCKDDGSPYTVFTPYAKKWRSLLRPHHLVRFVTEKSFATFLKTDPLALPSLPEIGFKKTSRLFPLAEFPSDVVANYDKTRDYPALAGTTRLGLHLRFGTVSIRDLVARGMLLNETWVNELIWREFFMQILYHFPHVVDGPFKRAYAGIRWQNDEELFAAWCNGRTGYPLVDAGMRELNATGFMHNRVRMVTASFLAKHLLIDWRWGENYFAQCLLDFDLAANNGNWQWSAGCGCDAAPYFRIFNPEMQAKKFDTKKKYVLKWVPELGTPDYVAPLVEHKSARMRALLTYKEAL